MSTQSKAIVDKLLTNVSNQLVPEGFICEEILPELKVKQTSGKIGKYGNGHLRLINSRVGGKGAYPTIDVTTRDSSAYHIEDHALKEILTEDDFDNVEDPFDAREDSTVALTTLLFIEKEVSLSTAMSDEAVFTQNITLSGTAQWSDYTQSDPLTDFKDGRKAVRGGCGKKANMAVLDEDVADVLRFHPQMLESLGFKDNRPGGLVDEELKKALKVEFVHVADVVYNSSNKGAADSLTPAWGKHFWFLRSEKKAAKRQTTLGYRMQKAGQGARQVYKFRQDEPINSEKIIVRDYYQQLFTNTNCAYFIKNAIA